MRRRLTLDRRDQQRIDVLARWREGKLTVAEAAALLGASERTAWRSRSDTDVTPAWTECRTEHYGAIENVWLARHARWDESADVLEGEYLDCLHNAG